MTAFNAEAYWADKRHKKWVVKLVRAARPRRPRPGEKRQHQDQTMYVSAQTKEGAINTAKHFTFLDGKVICRECRLATPDDLGCKPAGHKPA